MGIFDFLSKNQSNNITKSVKVKDIMTPDPILVSGTTTIAQIEKIFDKFRIWSIYVGEPNNYIGVITRKDFQNRGRNKSKSAPAHSIMSKGVISIDENAGIEEAQTLLYERKINGLAVTRNGKHCGIVTRYDITKNRSKLPDKNGDSKNSPLQQSRHGFIWTDEEIQLLKQLWGEGESIQIMVDRLKRHPTAIIHTLIDTGLVGYCDDNCDPKPHRFGFSWSEREIDQLKTDFKSGKSIPEIAATHQRNKNAILRKLVKLKCANFYDRMVLERYSEKRTTQEANSPRSYNDEIEIIPHDADTWFNNGVSLAKLKRYDDAIYAFDQAIEFNPNNARFWRNKGYALTHLDRFEEANSVFDQAIELNPKYAKVWREKGSVLNKLGRYEEALKAYDKSIEFDSNDIFTWTGKGRALANLGRNNDAIKTFDRAIEIRSDFPFIWSFKGRSLHELGRYEEAINAFDKAIEEYPVNFDDEIWNLKGFSLFALERYDDAIKAFEHAIEINPNSAFAWNKKGESFDKLGHHKDAIVAFDHAIQLIPKDAEIWFNKGSASANLALFDEAINAFEQATELNPNYARAWRNKGYALANLGRYVDAITAFDQAIEINPKYARAWRNKGYALANLGRYVDAITAYDQAIELNPKYAKVWSEKGSALTELGRHDEAIKAVDRAIELDPKNGFAWALKADCLLHLGHFHSSITSIEHAIRINPNITTSWIIQGISLIRLEDYVEAKESFDRAINLDPKNGFAWSSKAYSLKMLSQHDEAIKAFDRAVEIDPNNVFAWVSKADSLNILGQHDEAIKTFDRAIELNPKSRETIEKRKVSSKTILSSVNSQQLRGKTKSIPINEEINVVESHPKIPAFIIERTVFDPVLSSFLISKNRPLVNVESWIRKADPSSYWLIICIHNNSSSLIDEWGVELESSASLRILECHIEGVEHAPVLNESHPVPWQSKWIIGVPHHFGITLPRNGSRRIYFKLSSSTCGVSHTVKGRLIAPNGIQIPFLEKSFDHSCDVATLSTALSKNPAAAEHYTENLLMRSYSRETALVYLHSFKIIQEISQSCSIGNHDVTIDKLNQLIDVFEGTKVSLSLIESVKSNLWAIQELGDTTDASIRGQRLCQNIVDDWLNEVIYKQKKLG